MAVRIPFLAVHAEDDPVSYPAVLKASRVSKQADSFSHTKIAVDEAVPREEIKKNPYVVLCSTSLGGHLSWFEIGGNRWFARAVSLFHAFQCLEAGC